VVEKKGSYKVLIANLRERNHSDNLSIARTIILKRILKIGQQYIDRICVIRDGESRHVLKTIMKFRISKNAGRLWLGEELLTSHEEL
jgi:hypothetical protein